jgi:PRTRC genetic system ParB family protein
MHTQYTAQTAVAAARSAAAAYAAAQEGTEVAEEQIVEPTLPSSEEEVKVSVATMAHDNSKTWPNVVITTSGATLKIKFISTGANPREFFDEEEMASLTEAIRREGVLQSILLRSVGDTYKIVAGERRYRAAKAAFGEEYDMPVLIREMSDAEADAYAASENHHRADMSAVEWARVAAKEVGRANGDRNEAARVLGWNLGLLERRLALMNCSDAVLAALNQRKIKLGHAELLAALSKSNQDKLIQVIIDENKSVADVKQVITQASSKLEAAIFNKDQCGTCQHNSSLQATMFAETIVDGNCTNSSCYKAKTEDALQSIAGTLKDNWHVIRILRIGDNETRTKLIAEGPNGVGEEQAKACRGCANFGAAVSALPQAMGQVFENQCFDTKCNSEKVAERVAAETAALQAAAAAATTSANKASSPAAKTAGTAEPEQKAKAEKATSISESERVKTYREKVWRDAMKKEIVKNPAKSAEYLIALCLNGAARHISSTSLGKAFGKLTSDTKASTHDFGQLLGSVEALSAENAQTMTNLIAASAMGELEISKLRQLAKHHQLDLRKYWKVDAEFLELLVKSEIELLAEEIGLSKAIGDGFKKLFSEKKPDLIKKLLAVESFDYSATIPKVIAI